MIYVVLGMHKSGTTLVSQILHSSGINMGEFDASIHYDQGNKYERADSLTLDMAILGTESYGVLELSVSRQPELSSSQKEQMVGIIEGCEARHESWGLKDPRMCLTYQLWAKHLPPHKLIVVYRDPAQVWPRFKWRGRRGFATNAGRAYSYLRRWIDHNRRILQAIGENSADCTVLSYHELMTTDQEFERLQTFVGQKLTDHRQPSLYRNRSRPDRFLRFAGWALKLRTGHRAADTLAELDRVRAREISLSAAQ